MSGIDRTVVRQCLDRIVFECDAIALRLPTSAAEYSSADAEGLRYELEHRLFVALQAMLDAAAHVAVASDWRRLDSYRDALTALVALGALPAELGGRLTEAAGLRNLLAHEYLAVDDARIHAALARSEDLRLFAKAVWEWIEPRS